ncbi:unnamed protein product [Polarella glacialis]|uniref:Uncharacterized protein n=1 Tax=Polarella glacialis TaxID=89957 RepID=A0A813FPB6_POLGL|nr:unnamed protein product [Polarella glacialis]
MELSCCLPSTSPARAASLLVPVRWQWQRLPEAVFLRRCSGRRSRSEATEQAEVGRRPLAAFAAAAITAVLNGRPARASCSNLEECRERGQLRFEELEKQKGPLISLGKGIQYREARVGLGAPIGRDDVVDISYEVRKTNGDYIYSLGRGRVDAGNDFGETCRVHLGQHDVPEAVEMAMEGMREGGVRTVEMTCRSLRASVRLCQL